MPPVNTPAVGVCILRVERLPSHLLITVTTNRSVGVGLHSATPDSVHYFTRSADAAQAVAEFLRTFDLRHVDHG